MSTRKLLIAVAALPLALASVAAAEVESSSDSEALNINDQIVVGQTSATTEGDGKAEATAVELGGETVAGGSQEGEGSSSGSLAGGSEEGMGSLHVAPWSAEVDGEGNSTADAAAARIVMQDEETGTVTVLHSRSEATQDGSRAESTGAEVNLGDGGLHVVVLHSETSSDPEEGGNAYLASINGNEIGNQEQFDGGCEIPADPLLTLVCVYADEEGDATSALGTDNAGSDGVADLGALDGNLKGDAFQSSATGGGDGGDVTGAGDPAESPGGDDGTAGPLGAPSDSLPRTGGGFGLLGLLAMAGAVGLRRLTTS